jgi:hypothetical protein
MSIHEAKVRAVVRDMLNEGIPIATILYNMEVWTDSTIEE